MGKTLQELAADAVAHSVDYDPVQIDGIVNLNRDCKELAKQAAAKKLMKEPDFPKMKLVINQMSKVIEGRQTKWDSRYDEWKALSEQLKTHPRPLTPGETQALEGARKKCASSKEKYDELYNVVAELGKSISAGQFQKKFDATMLLNHVNLLRAKITEVGHVLMTIK